MESEHGMCVVSLGSSNIPDKCGFPAHVVLLARPSDTFTFCLSVAQGGTVNSTFYPRQKGFPYLIQAPLLINTILRRLWLVGSGGLESNLFLKEVVS